MSATSYAISCSGAGGSASAEVAISVNPLPTAPTVTLAAVPAEVAPGTASTLAWSAGNASTCTASGGWTGSRSVSGSEATAALTNATTYIISCSGAGGSSSAQATVGVLPQPVVVLSSSPAQVTAGGSSILSWSSTHATSCTASGGWTGTKATSGSQSTGPLGSTSQFSLQCVGSGVPSPLATTTVTVNLPPASPSLTFAASPSTVSHGSPTTLSWSTANVTSCVASGGWAGSKPANGSQQLVPLSDVTFTLACTGIGGTVQQSVAVTVLPLPTINFSAAQSSIVAGNSTDLSWTSGNATTCLAGGGWSGAKATNGTESTGVLTATTLFTLTCTGLGGSLQKDTTVTVLPDTSAPGVSITAPASGATVNGTTSILASANDNVGVAGVQFKVDGINLGAEDAAAPYSISWDTTVVTNGSHGITAVARDQAGNSMASGTVTVTVTNADIAAPVVSISAPANGATVSGSTSLTATATDNIGVVGVRFRVDGANVGTEDATPPYSISWDTTTVVNGSHTLTAVARDQAGNSTTSNTIVIAINNADTVPPTVSITGPGSGATVSGTVTFTAAAADNIGVTGVQFRIDGSAWGTEDSVAPYSNSWDSTTVANGVYAITATARDQAGNATTSSQVNVTVANPDIAGPAITVSSPTGGTTVTGTIPVSATASDNVGVVGVQFKVDGGNLSVEDLVAPYSVSWDSTSIGNGTHTVSAMARDQAGNSTTSSSVTVTVDNGDTVAPVVGLASPSNGATVSGTTSVSASATDNVGVIGVQFKLDGANLGGEDVTAPYTYSWATTTASNGSHTLAAVARDQAGNTATSTAVTVTVANDVTAPSVSISAPAGGSTVMGVTPVAATASDNVGVAGVQFKLDGINLGVEDTSSPYSTSWATTAAANGNHTLTAVARDAAGNSTTSASVAVTVNNAGGSALTINGNQTFQTIDGFGVSANSASWDNGELVPAIDLLLAGGSTIWRVVIEMADWEATNDNADPNVFNWTYYNSIFTSTRFEELWSTMAYLNSKGVSAKLILNFMGRGPAWMGGADLPANMEDEWVETVAAVAYYARTTRNLQFGLFSPNNEMDWDGIEGIRMSSAQNVRVLRKLASKLESLGLGDLRIVGPDTADVAAGVNSYLPAIMADSVVNSKVDHFAFHNYSGASGGADAAIKNSAYPNKNFWMTELSLFDHGFANVGQGASALLVWDGFDSVYNHAILAGRGNVAPNDAGNGPALLAYNSSTHVYAARKEFYEFSQLFKYVPAGSIRVAATESNGNVTIYAFTDAVSGRVTLVGMNTGGSGVTFSGTLANLPAVPSFEIYHTNSGSANMQRGTDIAVTSGAFVFTAPPDSIFTLTGTAP